MSIESTGKRREEERLKRHQEYEIYCWLLGKQTSAPTKTEPSHIEICGIDTPEPKE